MKEFILKNKQNFTFIIIMITFIVNNIMLVEELTLDDLENWEVVGNMFTNWIGSPRRIVVTAIGIGGLFGIKFIK